LLSQNAKSQFVDRLFREIYRAGFPIVRAWWWLRRNHHHGALVAIHVDTAVLLVRSSYRREWNFPGGTVRSGERPETAARRELAEEIGIEVAALTPAGDRSDAWDGRPEHVHFFEIRLDRLPPLVLDNREIVAARLFEKAELQKVAVTDAVAAYVARFL
jgi:8-oxo-dGTP diphosphatase